MYLLGRIINPYAHSCWITNPAEQVVHQTMKTVTILIR